MAFTTLQSVVDALPGQEYKFYKTRSASSGNIFISMWGGGSAPAAGADPSSGLAGDIPTSATTGAIPFVDPASGNTYLGRLEIASLAAGALSYPLIIYDRLWHNSGIVVTTTGAQTVNSTALTRPDANGEDAEVWLHVYSATGAGAATPTISYTNPAGTAGRTGTCIGYAASAATNRCFPFQLASGDTGVKSIESITLGTSLTSGTVGLIIRRKVAMVSVQPSSAVYPSAQIYDAIALGMPRVYDDACLEFVTYPPSTTGAIVAGTINLING